MNYQYCLKQRVRISAIRSRLKIALFRLLPVVVSASKFYCPKKHVKISAIRSRLKIALFRMLLAVASACTFNSLKGPIRISATRSRFNIALFARLLAVISARKFHCLNTHVQLSAVRFLFIIPLLFLLPVLAFSQDSSLRVNNKVVTLKEVVVRNNLNVQLFMKRVQEDTTFHKAFKNLRVLGYTALNDIRMFDKKGNQKASLQSKTKQYAAKGCRWMETSEEQSTGDIYDRSHSYNYYTADMYAGLFFTRDTICGETNIVAGTDFSFRNKKGIDKHKEQLKMLFFNPGKRIPGIPFIGDKIALFDEEAASLYDFVIDMNELNGEMCYVFKITPRADITASEKDRIVINEMTTWFSTGNWDILARNYSLSYRAGVYDFDVEMHVELTRFGEYLVPSLLKYNGNWDVIFKKRERGVFTATLFDFSYAGK